MSQIEMEHFNKSTAVDLQAKAGDYCDLGEVVGKTSR
jgi:hypothetical protein